ncbi:MAG: hypothetical protein PHG95_03220 [Patescibacteria group bacterium]|nr:hypothetical protein [Patescibacteria group bacterium]
MKNFKLMAISLIQALAASLYIAAISWILNNGERLFGKNNNFLGGAAILLLLVISATAMGAIILGKPVLMYWDGQKKASLKLFFLTFIWLLVIACLLFLVLALR